MNFVMIMWSGKKMQFGINCQWKLKGRWDSRQKIMLRLEGFTSPTRDICSLTTEM